MWRSARQAASKRTRTIPGAHERVLVAAMAFGEEGRWEGLRWGLITPDRSSSACREKRRRIETLSGFGQPWTVSPTAASILNSDLTFLFSCFLLPARLPLLSLCPAMCVPQGAAGERCGRGSSRVFVSAGYFDVGVLTWS